MPAVLLQELDRIAVAIEMPRATILFRMGQPCFGVFIVRRGRVVLRMPVAQKVLSTDIAGPGAILGLAGALTGTYTVSARAVEDSILGLVTLELVADILEAQPRFCRDAMEIIAHEIRRIRMALTRGLYGMEVD